MPFASIIISVFNAKFSANVFLSMKPVKVRQNIPKNFAVSKKRYIFAVQFNGIEKYSGCGAVG